MRKTGRNTTRPSRAIHHRLRNRIQKLPSFAYQAREPPAFVVAYASVGRISTKYFHDKRRFFRSLAVLAKRWQAVADRLPYMSQQQQTRSGTSDSAGSETPLDGDYRPRGTTKEEWLCFWYAVSLSLLLAFALLSYSLLLREPFMYERVINHKELLSLRHSSVPLRKRSEFRRIWDNLALLLVDSASENAFRHSV